MITFLTGGTFFSNRTITQRLGSRYTLSIEEPIGYAYREGYTKVAVGA